ncbi:MAG: hypothetical protein K8T91_17730 [Planctomycetes bacterium]|nr:hypothetical protein [Planctomycetota bacterium]
MFLAVALVLAAIAVWKLFFSESVYEGKSTSEWVGILESGSNEERQKAVAALQHIGAESVKQTSPFLTHWDEKVRLAAFDVIATVLGQCHDNFRWKNCVTGFVPGRQRAANAIPPIAEAMMGCLFGGDETLRRRSESVIGSIPWYYAIQQRQTAERLLDDLCRGLASNDARTREQAAALFEVIINSVSAWQSDLHSPTAGRLLDIAANHNPPSEPVMRSLLLCLVGCKEDPSFAKKVQTLESHIIEAIDNPPSAGGPAATGMALTSQYDDPTVRYWAAVVLLRYGTPNAKANACEALHDKPSNFPPNTRDFLPEQCRR